MTLARHLTWIGLAAGVLFCFPLPAEQPKDQPYKFSTNVQMVVLQTTVLNEKGALVSGLGQRDFRVLENNQPQELGLFRHADSPVAIGLIIDNSGSMRRRRPAVLAAATAFAKNSNPQDELFVVSFNDRPQLGLPGSKLASANSEELAAAIPSNGAVGKTALYDAIELGIQHIHALKQEKKALIVISDGGDNASTHRLEQVVADATNSDTVIYSIGLFGKYAEETNPAFLKQIAEVTGGEFFSPSHSRQAAGNCKKIAQTIRSAYTLGYSPKIAETGGQYRAIQVDVTDPRGARRLLARTRLGYTVQ